MTEQLTMSGIAEMHRDCHVPDSFTITATVKQHMVWDSSVLTLCNCCSIFMYCSEVHKLQLVMQCVQVQIMFCKSCTSKFSCIWKSHQSTPDKAKMSSLRAAELVETILLFQKLH